jgi:3-hydroxyacyl-[acyl-carrier-protein] dehydratase
MSRVQLENSIPHRPPFLFLDEIIEHSDSRIRCRKTWREDEWFYAGHYPNRPITPGVLLCEAAMQAGAALMALRQPLAAGKIPVATRLDEVRLKRVVRPGETCEIEVELTEQLADAFYMTAKVTVGGKLAARLNFAGMLADENKV